jgi:ketosteroid isomerase-like protein
MTDSLAIVQSIYAAFGRGDVPAILDRLADDVRWEAWDDNSAQKAGVPWLQPRRDKAGVLAFFQLLGAGKVHDFRVLSLMANGNQVAAEIVIDAELPGAGRFRDEEIHLWTLNEAGQVVRLRHYTDTAKHIAAARHNAAPAASDY